MRKVDDVRTRIMRTAFAISPQGDVSKLSSHAAQIFTYYVLYTPVQTHSRGYCDEIAPVS